MNSTLSSRLFKRAAFVAVLLGWAGALALGFCVLVRYESTPATLSSVVPARSNPAFRDGKLFTVALALHPQCPCSRATASELIKIYSHASDRMRVKVLAFKPEAEGNDWIRSSALSSLEPMHPEVIIDTNGTLAASLGMNVSGQVQVYSPEGVLLYNGGITAGRGHAGDNIGAARTLSLIRGEIPSAESAPVFGCSIQ